VTIKILQQLRMEAWCVNAPAVALRDSTLKEAVVAILYLVANEAVSVTASLQVERPLKLAAELVYYITTTKTACQMRAC
jgi:DNA polymerase III psi subunit